MNRAYIIVAVLATFALEVYCDPIETANMTVKDYCIKHTGISLEKVNKIENDTLEEPDEEAYCYIHCLFVSLELIDVKGKLDVPKVMEEFKDFDEDCLKKIPKIMECTDMALLDDCEDD